MNLDERKRQVAPCQRCGGKGSESIEEIPYNAKTPRYVRARKCQACRGNGFDTAAWDTYVEGVLDAAENWMHVSNALDLLGATELGDAEELLRAALNPKDLP